MLLKQYIKTIKQAKIESEEIKEFVELIKSSANLNQILDSAQTIIVDKECKNINKRVFNIAKTITILYHIDQNRKLYPYSEKDLDKLGYSIYKKFYE